MMQVPELKMFNPMAPLQAYHQGKQDAMQARQQEMAMKQQQMQLAEYEADAPYRARQRKFQEIASLIQTDQQITEWSDQYTLQLDPDAPDFDEKKSAIPTMIARTLVEKYKQDPELAYDLGDLVYQKLTPEAVRARRAELQGKGEADKPELDKASGQQFVRNPETGLYEAREVPGFTKPDKPESTPATDIDDFVADFEAQYIADNGVKPPPGLRNQARLEFKRAQSDEVYSNRLASRTADSDTAERIAYNGEVGTQLAVIETASAVAEAKGEVTPQQKIARAKKGVTGRLASLGGLYSKLDSMGAIVNIENDTPQNIWASARSSKLGQRLGKTIGTEDQSLRSTIDAIKPLLIQDIRQSTDMGARGLDSEKELEFYLQAATDTTKDIQANIAAIVVLDEAFGDGSVADKLRPLTTTKKITEVSSQGEQILQGGTRKQLDRETAKKYYEQAGRDKAKAAEMARADGYTF
jgi:hypothetical protein